MNNKNTKYKIVSIFIFKILFYSCDNNYSSCGRTGTIKDLLGQDGCTLVIEDNNGDTFIPLNINEFGLIFYDGQKVYYSFQLNSSSSNCSIGTPVTLLCIDTNT